MDNLFINIIQNYTREFKGYLCEETGLKLATYGQMLYDHNMKFNLTGFKTKQEICDHVILETLVLTRILDSMTTIHSLIDVGSGAGIPGILLAVLYPQLSVTLLDSNRKKCGFMRKTLDLLDLQNGKVINQRAEIAGRDTRLRSQYDAGICRAVAAAGAAAELTSPFVRVHGTVILLKGPGIFEELKTLDSTLHHLSCQLNKLVVVPVPEKNRLSYCVLIDKFQETSERYPRRTGMPQKKPLSR